MQTVKGLVVRERPSGENDKILSILTDDSGLLEVCAKGVRKANAKNAAVSQMLSYAKFCITNSRSYYILNSAEPIRIFYEIRLDVSKYALASYFCQMILFCCQRNQQNKEVLRLVLNTLHFLSSDENSNALLKSIFELRLLSEIGLIPNLIGCCRCYKYEDDEMLFDLVRGCLYCKDCGEGIDTTFTRSIDKDVLHGLRHIALSDMSKLFNIRIAKDKLATLSAITEDYAAIHLDKKFSTLDFYKSLQ